MALFPQMDDNAVFVSRTDPDDPLGSYQALPFFLDDAEWPSIAHYFHAMKFADPAMREKIRQAPTPAKAARLGRSRLKRIRRDWRDVRITVMTRAVYISCRSHPQQADALEKTGDNLIIENNSYDYFWGCGRDRRGDNHYGKILMNVRSKLREI